MIVAGLVAVLLSINPNVFNSRFFEHINDTTPTQIFFGGASSGKSCFVADRLVLGNASEARNALVIRNVACTLRGSCYAEIEKSLEKFNLTNYYDKNRTELTITSKRTGAQILFRGLDDVEKLKSTTAVAGPISELWIEEATEARESDINQATLRLRGKTNVAKRVTLTFNPINRNHWIYKRYFTNFDEGSRVYNGDGLLIHHSTYKDNKFLSVEDGNRIEQYKHIDPYFYDVYALGKWGTLGSLVYKNWSTADLSETENKVKAIRYGLDFGFTNDPTALVKIGICDDTIYVFREIVGHGWTNKQIAENIKRIVGDAPVWCDSSEPKSVRELQLEGINAQSVSKGRDSKIHGIQWIKQRRVVVDVNCQVVINELSGYQWKKNKWGESLNEPVDGNDHALDALRYGLEQDMLAIGSLVRVG